MGEIDRQRTQRCEHLKYKFKGSTRQTILPSSLTMNLPLILFAIDSASPADSTGAHCNVIAKHFAYPVVFIADPLTLLFYSKNYFFVRLRESIKFIGVMNLRN